MLTWKFGVPPPCFGFVRVKTKKWPPMPVGVIVYIKFISFRLDLINMDCFRAPYRFSVILGHLVWFYEHIKVTDLNTEHYISFLGQLSQGKWLIRLPFSLPSSVRFAWFGSIDKWYSLTHLNIFGIVIKTKSK